MAQCVQSKEAEENDRREKRGTLSSTVLRLMLRVPPKKTNQVGAAASLALIDQVYDGRVMSLRRHAGWNTDGAGAWTIGSLDGHW